jgi:hypothetical protein
MYPHTRDMARAQSDKLIAPDKTLVTCTWSCWVLLAYVSRAGFDRRRQVCQLFFGQQQENLLTVRRWLSYLDWFLHGLSFTPSWILGTNGRVGYCIAARIDPLW